MNSNDDNNRRGNARGRKLCVRFSDAKEIGKSGHASQLNSFARGFRFNYALVILLLLHIVRFHRRRGGRRASKYTTRIVTIKRILLSWCVIGRSDVCVCVCFTRKLSRKRENHYTRDGSGRRAVGRGAGLGKLRVVVGDNYIFLICFLSLLQQSDDRV